jgi:Protein of unknown function (DUF3761)
MRNFKLNHPFVFGFIAVFVLLGFISPVEAKNNEISAICRDGTYSYSRSRSGTCSGHGGVSQWCPCSNQNQQSGSLKYRLRGDCIKFDEDLIEIYEGETTSCELVVAPTLTNRGRSFSLQFYDEESGEWITESIAKAGSKGIAILKFEDIWTPDGNCYDDWSFLYRIVSEKTAGKKRLESNEIQVDFYSNCYSQ